MSDQRPNMEDPRSVDQNQQASIKHELPAGTPFTENLELVGQKVACRFQRVRVQLWARRRLFARQGAVVASWRVYRGRRLGPYYRLAFRDQGRQESLYLGRCQGLVDWVKRLIVWIQRPLRHRRGMRKAIARAKIALRRSKDDLAELLSTIGIRMKGWEFRGTEQAISRQEAQRRKIAEMMRSPP